MSKNVGFKDFTCCICGKRIKNEWGNNPWPIKNEGECCSACNGKVVAYRLIRLIRRGGV